MKLVIDIPKEYIDKCKIETGIMAQRGEFLLGNIKTAVVVVVANGIEVEEKDGVYVKKERV